ncbi:MAG TPA: type II toxin-antitoxin system VapC family toxin [Mycobacteriales bacterium]|nr:type II toxin-antitoxin system VapC family toxin [Mycobacteriales bacterium]
MTVFADASALVTLYAAEPGRRHLAAEPGVVIAQISRVEVPAALWRKQPLGELEPGTVQVLTEAFEADFYGTDDEPPRFAAVVAGEAVFDRAAALCAAHGLRAYDAVQLACALAAREASPDCATLAAYDENLRRAAAAEGFRLMPA